MSRNLTEKQKEILDCPTRFLPLSVRAKNVLEINGLKYFKDIPQIAEMEFYKFRHCGKKTLTEVTDLLHKYSLTFGMTYDEIILCISQIEDKDI